MERAEVIVATHVDLMDEQERKEALADLPLADTVAVSGVTGEGIQLLAGRLSEMAGEQAAQGPVQKPRAVILRPGREEFTVTKEGGRFRVAGRFVERWVADTDLEDPREVAALQRKLVKEGVERTLRKVGARRGDEVVIGDTAFEFIPAEGET
jgi:GTP-binding protein